MISKLIFLLLLILLAWLSYGIYTAAPLPPSPDNRAIHEGARLESYGALMQGLGRVNSACRAWRSALASYRRAKNDSAALLLQSRMKAANCTN